MKLFLASLLIVSIALIASSRLALRLRRSRVLTLLLTGGWLTLGAGVFFQFIQSDLAESDVLLDARPLIMTALGWIGLMVGMQARRDVLRSLPRRVWAMSIADAAIFILLAGVYAFVMLRLWTNETRGDASLLSLLEPAGMIAACCRASRRAMFVKSNIRRAQRVSPKARFCTTTAFFKMQHKCL